MKLGDLEMVVGLKNSIERNQLKPGDSDAMVGFFEETMEKGIQTGDYACSVLLNGLCYNWEVRVLKKSMEKKLLVPTVVIYDTIIDGYCRIGDMSIALEMV
ncbi:hypothetical protein CKAN_02435700 [Cinnamomum micranthum f. kanehirae]|uniref:Pentatricopeptide repeat-containing protein n=1 Tax=Cinnamomum micranthum f. kanehirae TaxID=337451 RepID=A0A443PW80_9MAGN|nr:hypothetical protein CKAN_02435700 [Cinnamomum micranthum f. kanehirae]